MQRMLALGARPAQCAAGGRGNTGGTSRACFGQELGARWLFVRLVTHGPPVTRPISPSAMWYEPRLT